LDQKLSLETGWTFKHKGLEITGCSLSGIRTCLTLPQHQIAFDVAQGLPFAVNMHSFFLSHGHLDHAAGVPYLISQKTMNSHPPARFYMPAGMVDPLREILGIWQKIEDHNYNFDFYGLNTGDRVQLNKNYFIEAISTVHRVDSLGYIFYESKKKLKAEFSHLPAHEIVRLKSQSSTIEDIVETPLFAFSGDTQIEALTAQSPLIKAQVLALECTYIDAKKPIEHAKKWGHLHLDELIPMLDFLQNEVILLIHISSRYSNREIKQILKEKIPVHHRDRIVLFEGR
jgi:ribonuclease Z